MTPKRIITSAVLFVLLFAGLAAASGLGRDAPAEAPSDYGLPVAHVGDRALYEAFFLDANGQIGPFEAVDLEVMPDESAIDRFGNAHAVHVIKQRQADWYLDWENETWRWQLGSPWFHRAAVEDDMFVGMTLDVSDLLQVPPSTESIDGLGLLETRRDTRTELRGDVYGDAVTPSILRHCLAANGMQGKTIALDRPVALFGPCMLLWSRPIDASGTAPYDDDAPAAGNPGFLDRGMHALVPPLSAVGMTEEGLLLLEGTDGGGRLYRVWLDDAIPYPAQLAWQGSTTNTWSVLRMTHFTRGAAPPQPAAPHGSSPFVPRWGAPEAFGLPEESVAWPFPPSEAYAFARMDPDIESWFEAHPGARLVRLEGWTSRSINVDAFSWGMDFSDGLRTLSIRVEKDLTTIGQVKAALPPSGMTPSDKRLVSSTEQAGAPDPAIAAPMAMTVSAPYAVSVFERMTGQTTDRASWKLTLSCLDMQGASCRLAGYFVEVGIASAEAGAETGPEPSVGFFASLADDRVWLSGQDGLPIGRIRLSGDVRERSGPTGSPADGGPLPLAPATARTLSWDAPSLPVVAATGGLAALVAVLYLWWPAIKPALWGLFSRVHQDSVLEHPARRRILDDVKAHPGIHFQELVRRQGGGRGTTEHHLRKLVETRQVTRKDAGGYVCFFPKGTDRRIMAAAPALRSETAQALLETIRGTPGITGGALADAVGINRGTVAHHMRRLCEAGVVDGKRDGRSIRYWAT